MSMFSVPDQALAMVTVTVGDEPPIPHPSRSQR